MSHATIQRTHFNALLKCLGNDNRFYLNGIHVNLDLGVAEATNGHRLLRVPLEVRAQHPTVLSDSLDAPLTIDPEHAWHALDARPFPKKSGDTLTLKWVNSETLIVSDGNGRSETLTDIDCKYPDTDFVINGKTEQPLGKRIGFNPLYLSDVPKALGCDITYLENHSTDERMGHFNVEFYPDQAGVTYIVMPCRA